METRIAAVSIVISDEKSVEKINSLLHNFADYIIGRMGIPYRTKNVSIICIALDAPADIINSLTGKLGRLPGVKVKTAYN